MKRFLLIASSCLVHAMEQFESGLLSNEAKLEDVFQPLLDIQLTAPDQSLYEAKHPERHITWFSAPARFTVQNHSQCTTLLVNVDIAISTLTFPFSKLMV